MNSLSFFLYLKILLLFLSSNFFLIKNPNLFFRSGFLIFDMFLIYQLILNPDHECPCFGSLLYEKPKTMLLRNELDHSIMSLHVCVSCNCMFCIVFILFVILDKYTPFLFPVQLFFCFFYLLII